MLDRIKPLHDLGFSILWLHPRSKRPIESAWSAGPRHGWETLQKTFRANFNVGVRLGENSKLADGNFLAVIDCDVKSDDPVHLAEMERALNQIGFEWESAPTVHSGRGNGSRHIYVKTESPLEPFLLARSHHPVKVLMPSAKKISDRDAEKLTPTELEEGWRIRPAWEISVMGSRQQVVLPPSVHPDTGREYSWSREILDENDIPLVSLVRPSKAGVTNRVPVKDSPEFREVVVDLVSAAIPDWCFDLIVRGTGLDRYNMDRSAAMYACALCLINAGFTDLEMMSVFTDPKNELAWTAYEHRKTKDRRQAADWVYKYTILKARHEKSAEKAFGDSAFVEDKKLDLLESIEQELDLVGDWREKLDRNFNNGTPKPTLKNVVLIFENVSEEKIFEFDEFNHAEIYASDPPWRDGKNSWKGREIADADLARIKNWFGEKFGFEPSLENITNGILVVSRRNTKHPVRDYLKSLRWDGVKRLDSWLVDYMGAEGPEDYVSAIGTKTLCAAVGRIMEPGCKWDYVLIFEGLQGIGKSTTCSILAGAEWFTDQIGDISNKDVVETMRGKWLIELGELTTLRKYEAEHLKHFITQRADKVRKAYARRAEEYPRQCVFIGTTNRQDYLKDETGNRRFWPVKVGAVSFSKLATDRDQLWAEAVERWLEGEALFLPRNIEDVARQMQAERMERDAWEEIIEDVLSSGDFIANEGFTLMELWNQMAKMSDIDGLKFGMPQQHRLGRCLCMMGYTKRLARRGDRVTKLWFRL